MFFSDDVQVKLSRTTEVFLFWQIFNVFAAGLIEGDMRTKKRVKKTLFFNRFRTP